MKNRDELAVFVDTIKESVSALDVGKALGLDIKRNRCKCPIHGGHDYNCVLMNDSRGYYCHVCHAHGDCISLVEEVLTGGKQKGTFIQAIKWINDAFNLGMKIDSHEDKEALKRARKRLKRKADARAFRQRIEKLDFDIYLAAEAALMRLEKQRDDNRPTRYSEDWNPKFCEAVEMIPIVRAYVERFAMNCVVSRK